MIGGLAFLKDHRSRCVFHHLSLCLYPHQLLGSEVFGPGSFQKAVTQYEGGGRHGFVPGHRVIP